MNIEQLTGRYFRLRQELADAYASVPWNTGHIDRLANELAATEREMAAASVGRMSVVKAPCAATEPPLSWVGPREFEGSPPSSAAGTRRSSSAARPRRLSSPGGF